MIGARLGRANKLALQRGVESDPHCTRAFSRIAVRDALRPLRTREVDGGFWAAALALGGNWVEA